MKFCSAPRRQLEKTCLQRPKINKDEIFGFRTLALDYSTAFGPISKFRLDSEPLAYSEEKVLQHFYPKPNRFRYRKGE